MIHIARPNKHGLDYFPLDIDIFEDEKIEYVTARFDEKGELIAIKLLCTIYRNGYYTDWNEDKATIFAKRAGRNISPSLANDVVNELVKRGFFDKDIFNSFKILTSSGIQKRYLSAIVGRNNVNIHLDYWLIDIPTNTQKTTFNIIPKINAVSTDRNSKNPDRNSKNPDRNSQIKENKNKKEINPHNPPMPSTVENCTPDGVPCDIDKNIAISNENGLE